MHIPKFGIYKFLLTISLVLSNSFLPKHTSARPIHNFYLSICEMVYKKDKQLLEISLRFFTDDFEKTILNYNNTQIITGLGDKTAKSDESIYNYLKDHFLISDKRNKKIIYNFVGWEINEEVSWCYAEAKLKNFSQLKVRNNLLTELFTKQKNLVYLKFGNKETSILLDIDNKSGVLTLD